MSAREQVAEAIYQAHRPYKNLDDDVNAWIYRQSADAAIAAHLGHLAATGHALVKLPEPVGVNGADNRVWCHVPLYVEQTLDGGVIIADRLGINSDELRDVAAALLAAAAKTEASE